MNLKTFFKITRLPPTLVFHKGGSKFYVSEGFSNPGLSASVGFQTSLPLVFTRG